MRFLDVKFKDILGSSRGTSPFGLRESLKEEDALWISLFFKSKSLSALPRFLRKNGVSPAPELELKLLEENNKCQNCKCKLSNWQEKKTGGDF